MGKYGLANNWETRKPMYPYGFSCWRRIMDQLDWFKIAICVDVGFGINTFFGKIVGAPPAL